MVEQMLLLPRWAESKQQQITIRLTVRDEVSALFQHIGDQLCMAWESVVQYIQRAVQSSVDLFASLFPHPARLSPQSRRYLATVMRRERYTVPAHRRRVSSRRLAVQQKRTRLGLDTFGRHWAYQGWTRRDILEIAVCIGGIAWPEEKTK